MKFHHLGIFVSNIKKGEDFFNSLIKIKKTSKMINDKKLGVKVKFLYDNKNICYELIAPLGPNNPVSKVLKNKTNILNHVAYKVKNLNQAISYMRKKNCAPITKPMFAKAFKRKVIFFLTPLNFIIELIEG